MRIRSEKQSQGADASDGRGKRACKPYVENGMEVDIGVPTSRGRLYALFPELYVAHDTSSSSIAFDNTDALVGTFLTDKKN